MRPFIHRATRIADRIAKRAGSELAIYRRGDASIELPAMAAGKENDRDFLIDACDLGDFGRPLMGDVIEAHGASWFVFKRDLDAPPWRWKDQGRTRFRIHTISPDEGLGLRTVTIQQPTKDDASSGQVTKSWGDYATFPAVIKTVDGRTAWDRDVQNRAIVDWQLVLPSTEISRAITPRFRVQTEGKTFGLGAAYRHNLQDHYVVLEAREVVQ